MFIEDRAESPGGGGNQLEMRLNGQGIAVYSPPWIDFKALTFWGSRVLGFEIFRFLGVFWILGNNQWVIYRIIVY